MAISLLASGIATGGTVGTTPCYAEVTIDSRGADFLFVGMTGDGAHPYFGSDVFTDTRTNVWTEMPGYPSPGDGYPGTTCQSRYFWCVAPLTSATHSFRLTTVNCGGIHTAICASAWIGMKQTAPFDAQIWAKPTVPNPLALSLGTSAGLAITPFIMGFGDGSSGSNLGTIGAGWTLLQRTASTNTNPEQIVGLNLAYRVSVAPATTTASWSYPVTAVSGLGGGIFSFLAAVAPVPPVTTTYAIRRLRRFMLPWDDANRMKFLGRLELVMQTGIGTVPVTNPLIMLRLSKDGGKTWGNEIQMRAGAMGAFDTRAYANILGRARNWVAEVSVSDPVDWQFLQCLVDYEEGTS